MANAEQKKCRRNFILPGLGARARRVVDSMRRLSSFARRVVLDIVVSVLVDANPRSVGVVGADAVRVSDICQTGIDSAVARHLVAFRLAVHKFLMPIGRTLTIQAMQRPPPPQAGHNVEASASKDQFLTPPQCWHVLAPLQAVQGSTTYRVAITACIREARIRFSSAVRYCAKKASPSAPRRSA